jgi:hypothetical protein
MEPKRYLFARLAKRESSIKILNAAKRNSMQKLLISRNAKISHIISNYSNISSPYNLKAPISISPLPKLKPNHPRARSFKLVTSTKTDTTPRVKHASFEKVNLRYLKQDFEDIEMMNAMKTPDESMKTTKNNFQLNLVVPDFEEVFTHCKADDHAVSTAIKNPACFKFNQ